MINGGEAGVKPADDNRRRSDEEAERENDLEEYSAASSAPVVSAPSFDLNCRWHRQPSIALSEQRPLSDLRDSQCPAPAQSIVETSFLVQWTAVQMETEPRFVESAPRVVHAATLADVPLWN